MTDNHSFTTNIQPAQYTKLSNTCFFLGFASIAGLIAIRFLTGGSSPESQAHAERFGIFVGLWAPTVLTYPPANTGLKPASVRMRFTSSRLSP
jgi:hypothetical protein